MRRRALAFAAIGLAALAALAAAPARKPAAVAIRIVAFNDFHGHLAAGQKIGGRPVGGAAVLASWIREARRGYEGRSFQVDAGDLVGASPAVSGILQDEPTVQLVNALASPACTGAPPFDPACDTVGTVGNHEFDEGPGELMRLLRGGNHAKGPFLQDPWRGARFPVVAANVADRATGASLLPGSVVLRAGGVAVGFVGAVLRGTPRIVRAGAVAGLDFGDEAAAIGREVEKLKAAGVRAIVVLIHEGGRQEPYDGPTDDSKPGVFGPIASIVRRLDPEVDVVISGHTHTFTNVRLPAKGGKKVLATQAWDYGKALAVVDLAVDPATGDVVRSSAAIETAWGDAGPGLKPDPGVAAIVAAAEARVGPEEKRVVATAREPIPREIDAEGESPLGDLIADAHRAVLGADVAFMNRGGVRAALDAGPVTWGELFEVQPFGGAIVKLTMTGAQLAALLEEQWWRPGSPRILYPSGLTYAWDPARPAGSRLVSAEVGGKPLDREHLYTVAVNAYLADGGDGFRTFGKASSREEGPTDVEALETYLKALPSPFGAPATGRVRRVR